MTDFKLRVTKDEARQHFVQRAAHHSSIAEALAGKVMAIRQKIKDDDFDVGELLASALGTTSRQLGYDDGGRGVRGMVAAVRQQVEQHVQQVERNIARHGGIARAFSWYAGHLAEEHYDLTLAEAGALEFVPSILMMAGIGYPPLGMNDFAAPEPF